MPQKVERIQTELEEYYCDPIQQFSQQIFMEIYVKFYDICVSADIC